MKSEAERATDIPEEDDWPDAYRPTPVAIALNHPPLSCVPWTPPPQGTCIRQTETSKPSSQPRSQPQPRTPNLAPLQKGPDIPHRKLPNHFPAFMSRSALFKAGRSSTNLADSTELPAQGYVLRVQGPRLTMRDKQVWETAIQIAKESADDLSSSFEIGLRDFARRMGSTDFNGKALAAIWASLQRLAEARIQFSIPGSCSGVGSMLSTAVKQGSRCYVRLNPDFALAALAGDKQFKIHRDRRSKLAQALAQWLHDFFSTHSVSRDLDLKYLRNLCGFDGRKRNFPEKLRLAMAELCAAAPELIASFSVEEIGWDGDAWILKVVKGSESPEFKLGERSIAAKLPNRRGGVAL